MDSGNGFNVKNTSLILSGKPISSTNHGAIVTAASVTSLDWAADDECFLTAIARGAACQIGASTAAQNQDWLLQVPASPERGIAPSDLIPAPRTNDVFERLPDVKNKEFKVTQRVVYPYGRTMKRMVEVWSARKPAQLIIDKKVRGGIGSNQETCDMDKNDGVMIISTGQFNEEFQLVNGTRFIPEFDD